jgi:hypothetical protein
MIGRVHQRPAMSMQTINHINVAEPMALKLPVKIADIWDIQRFCIF